MSFEQTLEKLRCEEWDEVLRRSRPNYRYVTYRNRKSVKMCLVDRRKQYINRWNRLNGLPPISEI